MVGKKKRGHPDVEEVLARPWCYYCERDFDDLKILISHQKAKHFKCERCGRRLNTAGGLSVHMNQVHKETLTSVDNALGNRAGLEVEIFGMEGIPEEVAQAHNQRIVTQFYQAEADRRAATGNTGQGGGGGGVSKKPKFEPPSELKKRLAEHKARLAEQAAGGGSSGENTPGEALNAQSPALAQSPSAFNGSPYPPPPNTYDGQSQPGYQSYSQAPYQPPTTYQPQYNAQPAYSPPQSQYAPQYPPQSYPPQQSFPPAGYQQTPFQGGPPAYSAGSPPAPYNAYQPPPGMLPNRPPGLPGLPQRPSFGAPGAYPPQQMQGPPGAQYPGQGPPPNGSWNGNGWKGLEQNAVMSSAYPPHSGYNGNNGANAGAGDDIDEIIRMAEAGIRPPKKGDPTPTLAQSPSPLAPVAAAAAFAQLETPQATTPDIPGTLEKADLPEKKSKKDKEKNTKMVYSDNEVSPEEKMARLPRYAFVPETSSDASPIKTADAEMVTA